MPRITLAVRRRGAVAAVLAVAVLVPGFGSAGATTGAMSVDSATTASATCTSAAAPAAAAVDLYGTGAELVRAEEISGLRTALVLEPRIAPGTRRRMLDTGAGWCDAASAFNRAWGTGHTGADTAAAFASVAATPYFDGVTVQSVTQTAAGAYLVRTHALTNGIEAQWVIATDAAGVRTATWTARGYAVKPFEAEIEGLTALPGGTETYTRVAGGLLTEKRGLPTAESARRDALTKAPTAPHVYRGPDGMEIRLSVSDTHVAADPDISTGQTQADTLTNFADAIEVNYKEFHDWGLRKGWESDLDPALGQVGWVFVNNSLSLYCQACVFIANDFQIHTISELNVFLSALGFNGYKNERDAILLVMGHEMFHNFQNAYNNPGPLGRSAGRGVSTAYSEGTARFQETLHSYSDVTFANKTLYTGGQTNPPGLSLDANHCNGYGSTEAAFSDGPFPKTYNACYFWTSWYNQNGVDSLVRLVSEGIPANATKANQEEGLRAIAAAAPDVPVADQLAFFAQSALTGRDKTITSASGGVTRDWGSFLFKWNPATLSAGSTASRSLGAGGVFGRRLTAPATVSLSGAGLALYVVRADAAGTTTTALPAAGAAVEAPASGETVWLVAVNPTYAAVTAQLRAS